MTLLRKFSKSFLFGFDNHVLLGTGEEK